MSRPPINRTDQLRLGDWAYVKSDLDWIYEGPIDPQWRETTQQHAGQSVFLLRQGSLFIRNPKGNVRVAAGNWVLPCQENRYERFSEDARVLSIHLHLNWPGGEPLFYWDVAATFPRARAPRLEQASKRLLSVVEREFPSAHAGLLGMPGTLKTYFRLRHSFSSWLNTFIETLLELGWSPSRIGEVDPRILSTVHLLDRLPLAATFSEKETAAAANLSASQLDRLFVKQFGLTPRRYFEQRRLEMAKAYLRDIGPIKEIAFELGFSSLPRFSGWFHNKTGLSPREFRAGSSRPPGAAPKSSRRRKKA